MKRTPEWYEAYQRRQVAAIGKAGIAAEWNGNVEPVKLVRGAKPVPIYPLVSLCERARIAVPVPEYKFHPSRKWRFDYAFPLHMLAVEIEGGLWTNGRHSRGSGAIADLEKYSEAAILGWRLIYATPQDLENGVALDRVIRALTDRAAA